MFLSLNKETEAVQFILLTSAHVEKVLSLLESTEPSIHESHGSEPGPAGFLYRWLKCSNLQV